MTTFSNEGPATNAETIYGNVDTSCTVNKNSIILPLRTPIPDVINFRVAKPEVNFAGRSDELKQLKHLLSSKNAEPIVVSGMGGVGKTQLARKYIAKNRSKYAHVIWIDVETENGIEGAFKQLAQDILQLPTTSACGQPKDSKSITEQVLQTLCQRKSLFIYDNVDSIESMKFVLAMAPPPQGKEPQVLITSRFRKWRTGIEVILLKVWSSADAVDYISETLIEPHKDSKDERVKLAEMLQYFPLALQQASSFINHKRQFGDFKISQYISTYNRNTDEMLQSEYFQEDSTGLYNSTTYTTWNITIEAIKNNRKSGHLAIRIFNMIAFFDADKIERRWFNYLTFDGEKQQADQAKREECILSAVDLLVKYSMIDSQDKQQQCLAVHRLVQQVTKLKLKQANEESNVLRDALQTISNLFKEHMWYSVRHHAIPAFISALLYSDLVKEFSSLSITIVKSTFSISSSDKRKRFADAILEPLTKILGENDRVVLKVRYYFVQVYMQNGLNNEALKMNLDIFDKWRIHFGEDYEDTLKTQCQVADSYHRLGEDAEACKWYEDALKIERKRLGENNPNIFVNMLEMAFRYRFLGDHNSALKLYQFIFQKQKATLGDHHASTLKTKHKIAFHLTELGLYNEALPLMQEVYERKAM